MVQNISVEGLYQEEEDISREDINRYRQFANGLFIKLQKLEKQVNEVEQFYKSTNVQANGSKNKGHEKPPVSTNKPPLYRAPTKNLTASEGMQEIGRHFSKILHELTQHEWAWPFMKPVDVKGLGLDDYHQIIKKPMDFSTIKRKMEARDRCGYKSVREIYADVKLIFTNAMTYNGEDHDVHKMAKTLLDIFEKKWLHLLPKVYKAENEQRKEESEKQLEKQLAQEATYANMTLKLSAELSEVDKSLENLKATIVGKSRKLSIPERVALGTAMSSLSSENLSKALRIVYENDPNFKPETHLLDVDFDLNSQSDYIVWRLYNFVKSALKAEGKLDKDQNTDSESDNNAKRRKVV